MVGSQALGNTTIFKPYDQDGAPLGGDISVPSSDTQMNSRVIKFGSVVLGAFEESGLNNELRLYQSTNSGTQMTLTSTIVQSSTTGNQDFLTGAELADGSFVAAWRDNGEVEFRQFDDSLTPTGTDTAVTTGAWDVSLITGYGVPLVTALDHGGFLI